MPGHVFVGTSGWSYDHWGGAFYPEGLPASRRLEHYVTRFPAVEINASFYRLPTEDAVARWRQTAPEGFRFAVKGSRLITHYRRLSDIEEAARAFLERVEGLGPSLAVVLWQLPPQLDPDPGLLDSFLGSLPKTRARHAVEFRDAAWLTSATFEVLRRHGAAHVQVSSSHMPADLTVTTDFAYVRLHGLTGYSHDYPEEELEPWARFLMEQDRAGRDAYAFFNNDARARAPANAQVLVAMLGEAARPWGGAEVTGRGGARRSSKSLGQAR